MLVNQSISDTEGGRIARVVRSTDDERRRLAVQKARMFYTPPCCKKKIQGAADVPSESVLLKTNLANCGGISNTIFWKVAVPESVRIAQLQQDVLSASVNPLNSETRFSEYAPRPVPPVCPPIPQELLNSNIPRLQLKTCPLPNKSDNPVLPG